MSTLDSLVTQLRPSLLRTARHRLRNPDWAEDAVSETVLAALQSPPDFTEPARVRAWLFGVLRNKVVDQQRLHLGDGGGQILHGGEEVEWAEIGDTCPRADPMHRMVDRQFIEALGGQLERLPQLQARAFLLRECLGHDTVEVCEQLAITAGNLWVVLHRTRSRLRRTLAAHHA